jgi:short-subunit dehydrogenase
LPLLKARDEAHIVNISSMGGFLPVPGQAIYGASKAALKLMTEALWAELKDTSVRVTVIFTGAVSTNITTNSGLAMPEASTDQSSYKMLDANKAAKLIIEAMVKNKFRATVGSDASLMDKLYRLHPRFATGFIAKQMKALLG